MAWTTPRTWTTGELVTAAIMNTHVRDEFNYLKDSPTFDGAVYIGDNSNADVTLGLTINQGANDNAILALKSSDVAHGITSVAETDTYGFIAKTSPADGGLYIGGFSEGKTGIILTPFYTTGDTGRATTALGAIYINVEKKSGTAVTTAAANENLLVVANDSVTEFLVDAEGDIHMNATSNINAWDEYDDMALLAGVRALSLPKEHPLRDELAPWIAYARPILAATGVVSYNDDGRHFLSLKGFMALTLDALRQVSASLSHANRRTDRLVAALLSAGVAPALLEGI